MQEDVVESGPAPAEADPALETPFGETAPEPQGMSEHDFNRAEEAAEPVRKPRAAEMLESEGGGGFNPSTEPQEEARALAPERNFSGACSAPEERSPITVPERLPVSASHEEATNPTADREPPPPEPQVSEIIAEPDSSSRQLPELEPIAEPAPAPDTHHEPVAAPIITFEPDRQSIAEPETDSKPEPEFIAEADSMPIGLPVFEATMELMPLDEPAVEPETGKYSSPVTEMEAGPGSESAADFDSESAPSFSPADLPEPPEQGEECGPITGELPEEQPSGAEATQEPLPDPPAEANEAPGPLEGSIEPAAANAEPAPPPSPTPQSASEPQAAHRPMITKFDDEVFPFSVFVGQVYDDPLDLLLDLIRKQDIDIYDIPIARITAQFLAYVNQLKASDVDTAGEFIYTASLLIHIKSKMLLPRAPAGPDDQPEDPRRELVERLLEHERFKNAAQMLQQKQMLEAATWTNPGLREFKDDAAAEPEIAADTVDLVRIFRDILERARNRPVLNVEEDSVTVGQMIQFLGRRLSIEDKPVALRRLLSHTRSERALIAMFLALLELVRLQAVLLRQDRAFSEIFVKKHSGFDAAMNEGLSQARDDWK